MMLQQDNKLTLCSIAIVFFFLCNKVCDYSQYAVDDMIYEGAALPERKKNPALMAPC